MDLLDLMYSQSDNEHCTDLVFIAKFDNSLWLVSVALSALINECAHVIHVTKVLIV